MNATPVERRLRAFCRTLAVFICVGTALELWLVDHTGGVTQWVPFALCAALAGSVIVVTMRPTRRVLLAHRVIMALVVVGAGYGVYTHFIENLNFAREIRPTAPALEVWRAAVTGASPLLASGILAIAAALGAAGTYGVTAAGQRTGSRYHGPRDG